MTQKKPLEKRKIILRGPKANRLTTHDNNGRSNRAISAILGAFVGNLIAPGIGGALVGGVLGGTIGEFRRKEIKMARIPVFYSFHFANDVMRVQQVRNIGAIEGNPPASPNDWERLKRTGTSAVENWIAQNMKYRRCVVVLIGSQTAGRRWINYEIEKAWKDGRALMGIYIHNLRCPRNGTSRKGRNPFDEFHFEDGRRLSSLVPCYEPNPANAYQDIADNIAGWIEYAIAAKQN